jgi:hypothetical protein
MDPSTTTTTDNSVSSIRSDDTTGNDGNESDNDKTTRSAIGKTTSSDLLDPPNKLFQRIPEAGSTQEKSETIDIDTEDPYAPPDYAKKKKDVNQVIPNNDFICVCKVCFEELDMNWVETPDIAGCMTKKGGLIKNWKKRWFVLHGKHLAYYETKQSMSQSSALGLIHLDPNCKVEKTTGDKSGQFGLTLTTPGRTYYFVADSEEDRGKWISNINQSINRGHVRFCKYCRELIDVAHDPKPEKTGVLMKMGHMTPNWKIRYFILSGCHLAYYETKEDAGTKRSLGLIHLQNLNGLVLDKEQKCIELHTPERIYYFIAQNLKDLDAWKNAINRAKVKAEVGVV